MCYTPGGQMLVPVPVRLKIQMSHSRCDTLMLRHGAMEAKLSGVYKSH